MHHVICYKGRYDEGIVLRGMDEGSEDLQLAYSFPVWSALWAPRVCLLSL